MYLPTEHQRMPECKSTAPDLIIFSDQWETERLT